MEHTSNQPTLVHAKFLVSLFKKGIELAGEMPETVEILMILLENNQPIESFWNFLVNIFLFRLSISIPSFSLDMVKHDETPGRHSGIIIPAETIEICVRMKMVYNPSYCHLYNDTENSKVHRRFSAIFKQTQICSRVEIICPMEIP